MSDPKFTPYLFLLGLFLALGTHILRQVVSGEDLNWIFIVVVGSLILGVFRILQMMDGEGV